MADTQLFHLSTWFVRQHGVDINALEVASRIGYRAGWRRCWEHFKGRVCPF